MNQQSFGSRQRPTMDDVARKAGVSRALVSIVVRHAPGASEETRRRVYAAAEELGYQPDVRAQSLAGQRSRVIGMMFGLSAGTFHIALADETFAAAEAHGHNVIMAPLTRTRNEAVAARALQGFRFDALIMLNPPTREPHLAGKIPVAVVGWHVDHPNVDVVRHSDEQGMAAAVDHLVTLGHRDIAHIDGGDQAISDARRSAYLAAMRRHGLDGYVRVMPGGQSQMSGVAGALMLCSDAQPPTALIAYNDDVAVAAMGVFIQRGLRIPDQISVVGYDNADVGDLSPVPLTTVAQRPHELARFAVERLIARVEHQRIVDREIVLDIKLKVRSSTAPPRR